MNNEVGIARRLSFNRIDEETRAALREARPFVAEILPAILDRFYLHLERFSETAVFFGTSERMKHAKEMQYKHWLIIMSGEFDETYEASVTRIGEIHNKLGLEPRWYIGGYSALVTDLVEAVALWLPRRIFERNSQQYRARVQKAIIRAAMLDMDLAISVYIDAGKRERRAMLEKLAGDFETAVGGVVNIVASAATELQSSARSLRRPRSRPPVSRTPQRRLPARR